MEDFLNLIYRNFDSEKCTFYAKNVIRRLSRSISSHFSTIHSWNVCHRRKSQKITKNPFFEDSKSFKVIDIDTNKKLVTIACYDKQHVYLSAIIFTLHKITAVK